MVENALGILSQKLKIYRAKLKSLPENTDNIIFVNYRFAALENISKDEDINRAWESIKENIKTSATGVEVCTK